MGRHIASHRRHVTRRDTAKASRHVTHPLRGVTCDVAWVCTSGAYYA